MDRSPPPQRPVARGLAALLAFFRSNEAGGAVLVVAALVALAWANSPFAAAYDRTLTLPVTIGLVPSTDALTVHAWINEGLMTVFFLLVALEMRREMTEGALAGLARMAAPGLAALGGMLVPAGIYVAFAWRDPVALRGWAVPVATDIAFALAVLSLLGRRVPVALKIFLTALAVIDDLGAIAVIALFYAGTLHWAALSTAAGLGVAVSALNRLGIRALSPYLLGGVLLWIAVQHSGLNATLAGVVLAFLVPMRRRAKDGPCTARRLEGALGGWVAYVILPLFGLANAGLRFETLSPSSMVDPVFLGIAAGLFIGKPIGVCGTTMLACRVGLARLPHGLRWSNLYGASLLCGIGFTMSLFIGDIAFHGIERQSEIKLAVFSASLLSAAAGLVVLAAGRISRPGR